MSDKIKVIIADDIYQIAEMNKKIVMKNENVDVIGVAYNGKEELDMILNLKPDLVITDNKMPEMNGIEVIEKINSLEIENKVEFILVTGDYNIELNEKCNELGVLRVISKLSVERNLLDAIDEYILIKNNLYDDIYENSVFVDYSEENITENKKGLLKKILEFIGV